MSVRLLQGSGEILVAYSGSPIVGFVHIEVTCGLAYMDARLDLLHPTML